MHLHDAEQAYSRAIHHERATQGTPAHDAAKRERQDAFLLVMSLTAQRNAKSRRKVRQAYALIGAAYRG